MAQPTQQDFNNLSESVRDLAHVLQADIRRRNTNTRNRTAYQSRNNTLGQSVGAVGGQMTNMFAGVLTGLRRTLGGSMNVILGSVRTVGRVLTGNLQGAFNGIRDIVGGIRNAFGGIIDMITSIVGTGLRLFTNLLTSAWHRFMEMQKISGNLAADIGLTNKEARGLLLNFTSLTMAAMEFGGHMEDVAELIHSFSEITSKNRLFDTEDVRNIVELGKGTNLGVKGASELVSEFDNLGISFKDAIGLTNKARDSAAKLNLNSGKVLTTYSELIKGLTGYPMRSGLDNMVKLATTATQLRIDITNVAKTMSDKLFDPEGAIEAAAKIQVLGGAFADKFGDPFNLMYAAQNAPEEFAKNILEVTKGLAQKNSQGIFFIPPTQLRILREASEALGQDFEQLKNSAIEQAKIADKMGVLNRKGFIINDEDRQALSNLTTVKDGKYFIKIAPGIETLLENLTSQSQIDDILNSRKKDDEAAKRRMNLQERFENIINRFMMGFTQAIARVNDILDDSKLMNTIENFGITLGNKLIPMINDLFNPNGTFAKILGDVMRGAEALFDKITSIVEGKGTFWEKLKTSIVELMKGVWDIVSPYLQAGFGKLFAIVGKALPSWLGGEGLTKEGLAMMISAGKGNKTLNEAMGGSEGMNQKIAEHNKLSGGGGYGLIGGAAGWGVGAALAPETFGLSLLIPAIGAAIGYFAGKEIGSDNSQITPVDDALMTPTGQIFKGGKGDFAMLLDQAGFRNGMNNNTGTGLSKVEFGGTITVRSEDGKEVTISDLDRIGRETLGTYIKSLMHNTENGYALSNNSKMPITPIST